MPLKMENYIAKGLSRFRIKQQLVRECLAEFLGTFVLLLFGDAVVAQVVLSDGAKGDFFTINWGWGVSVTLAVLISGGVSGGHVNPAVTVAMAAIGKLPLIKVVPYMISQYFGAILASAVVFGVYHEGILDFEEKNGNADGDYFLTPKTAGIFATYPQEFLTHQGGLADQIVSTALLLLCVCAIADSRNMSVSKGLVPLYVGFVVLNIGMCFGYNCGYAINPARDLGPRLFTLMAGWGTAPFEYGNHWWVVPVIGTHVGAVIGAVAYMAFVECHWDGGSADDNTKEVEMQEKTASPEETEKMVAEDEKAAEGKA